MLSSGQYEELSSYKGEIRIGEGGEEGRSAETVGVVVLESKELEKLLKKEKDFDKFMEGVERTGIDFLQVAGMNKPVGLSYDEFQAAFGE